MAEIQKIGVPFRVYFHFSFWIFLYILLHQNEAMNALDQLKERVSKREANLKKKKEKKQRGNSKELQRVKEDTT
jgi:hypothetical protein